MVGALLGAAVDLADGAPDLADEGGELGVLGVAGAEVLDRGEVVGEAGDFVVARGEGEPELEQLQGFEQEIVGGRGGDAAPVGFEQLEVVADGGVGEAELFADLAQRVAALSEVVDAERAAAAGGVDLHG